MHWQKLTNPVLGGYQFELFKTPILTKQLPGHMILSPFHLTLGKFHPGPNGKPACQRYLFWKTL